MVGAEWWKGCGFLVRFEEAKGIIYSLVWRCVRVRAYVLTAKQKKRSTTSRPLPRLCASLISGDR